MTIPYIDNGILKVFLIRCEFSYISLSNSIPYIMKKLRYFLLVLAIIVIAGQCFVIDYQNPSWSENTGSYLSIISMIMLVVGLTLSLIEEKKQRK